MRVDRSSNGSDSASRLDRAKSRAHKLEKKVRHSVTVVTTRISSSIPHEDADEPPRKVRHGIISINGRDVETIHCSGGHHHHR